MTPEQRLHAALAAAPAPVRFWWRDDDAGRDHSRLATLLELSCSRAAPLGLAVVPESAANLQLPGVRYHLLRSPQAKVDLSCVYREDNSSPALAVFLDIVHKLRNRKIKLVTE